MCVRDSDSLQLSDQLFPFWRQRVFYSQRQLKRGESKERSEGRGKKKKQDNDVGGGHGTTFEKEKKKKPLANLKKVNHGLSFHKRQGGKIRMPAKQLLERKFAVAAYRLGLFRRATVCLRTANTHTHAHTYTHELLTLWKKRWREGEERPFCLGAISAVEKEEEEWKTGSKSREEGAISRISIRSPHAA